MTEFDTGLPNVRQVQKYIKDKQKIAIKLVTEEILVGNVIWQDSQCLCLADESQQSIMIWRQALVYIKPA
ncbi:Hfq-related RNA-binding protein [Crocosphaera sp. XPORK-15E]|uniref:Hfq-related RNA-binding protein n=1 Tax=Crocosphaera sp. XPORK-15E TaxID=3110247 RepID=UPI002B1F9C52|nr:RNA-binding protein hfq [Crocosphaera sp. XPORK-15E]MEA5533022.1 RNA-binding protein hfq [Crocosphaera sp. XPORK-15E]